MLPKNWVQNITVYSPTTVGRGENQRSSLVTCFFLLPPCLLSSFFCSDLENNPDAGQKIVKYFSSLKDAEVKA